MVPTLCANTTGPVAGVVVADGVADAVGEGEAVAAGPAWLPQAASTRARVAAKPKTRHERMTVITRGRYPLGRVDLDLAFFHPDLE